MIQKNFSKIFIRLSLRLFKSRDGVAVMEYGLLVALISLVLIVALKTLGISLSGFMNYVAELMSDA
jgi:Flp pilus assembly pilin Flp